MAIDFSFVADERLFIRLLTVATWKVVIEELLPNNNNKTLFYVRFQILKLKYRFIPFYGNISCYYYYFLHFIIHSICYCLIS